MATNYFLKRVGQAALTFVATVSLSFVLYQAMPGGPVEALKNVILSQQATTGGTVDLDRINRLVGLYTNVQPDQPLHVQFYQYFSNIILNQDLGRSIYQNKPVTALIFERIPWSMFISVYAMVLGYAGSILIGSLMAFKEKSRFDSVTSILMILLNSVPYYIVGIVLIYFVAIQYELFPYGGRVASGLTPGFNWVYMKSIAYHAALPVFSMSMLGLGGALTMRGNAVRVLGEDYLRVAHLRGLRGSRIATQYVGRNAILPMYTQFMIGIAGVLSSSVIVERIFSYPGVGQLMFKAIQVKDYPLLMGSLIIFTTVTIVAILIADLTYGLIDPRISAGGEQ